MIYPNALHDPWLDPSLIINFGIISNLLGEKTALRLYRKMPLYFEDACWSTQEERFMLYIIYFELILQKIHMHTPPYK